MCIELYRHYRICHTDSGIVSHPETYSRAYLGGGWRCFLFGGLIGLLQLAQGIQALQGVC